MTLNSNNNYRSTDFTSKSKIQSLRLTPLDKNSHHFISERWRIICMWFVFVCVSTLSSTLIIWSALRKRADIECNLTFKKTIKHEVVHDSRPRHAALGYFNHDIYSDMAVANSGVNNIGIFLQLSNGRFSDQVTYSTGFRSHPNFVAVADINNDNVLDLVVANFGTNNIGLFFGNGDGTFRNQIKFQLNSSRPVSLAIGNFSDDEHADIVVANYGTSNVILLIGLGNGSFEVGAVFDMGYDSAPCAVVVADFNKDNYHDITITNYGTSNFVVLLSNGNGSFTSYTYSMGSNSHPLSITINDFNNDSLLDIAVANSGTNKIELYMGKHNGTFNRIFQNLNDSLLHPEFVTSGDLDNDGIQDIIVASSENSKLVVFKGNGDGKFLTAIAYSLSTHSNPCSLAIGNLNNDDKLSIVVVNNGTNNIDVLTLFKTLLDATLTNFTFDKDVLPNSICVGDFNSDKNLDIIVGDMQKNIIMLLGFDNGTFQKEKIVYTPRHGGPYSLAVGDFNNDDKTDIVFNVASVSAIEILLGDGDGNFSYGGWYDTGNDTYASSITVADINNDHTLDILVPLARNDGFEIFFGYGNGEFGNMHVYVTGDNSRPTYIATGHVNNDELIDLIVAVQGYGAVYIYLGIGNGLFDEPIKIFTNSDSPAGVSIGLLNSDNYLDIVYLSGTNSYIGVLLGYGNGSFHQVTRYFISKESYPWSINLADLNRDSNLDIVVASMSASNIMIFFGEKNGTFNTRQIFSSQRTFYPRFTAIADFNKDSQSDIAVTNLYSNEIVLFIMDIVGTFQNIDTYATGSSSHPYSVAVADINDDSQLDVVVTNSGSNSIQILFNYEDDVFINATSYSTGSLSYPKYLVIADFNRDNLLDIAVTDSENNAVKVFAGLPDGRFDNPTVHPTGLSSSPNSIAIGDFNNDERLDLVISNQVSDTISLFLGFSYATFTKFDVVLQGVSDITGPVITADVNGDYYLDIIVGRSITNNISVYLGYGNGSFQDGIEYTADYFPYSIVTGDFNHDNKLDLAIATLVNVGISVLINKGDGQFFEAISYNKDNKSSPFSIAISDFNNDAFLDIAAANIFHDSVSIIFGYGDGTFGEPTYYTMPDNSRPSWVAVTDFNEDNSSDIVVAIREYHSIGILLGYGNGSFQDLITYYTGKYSGPCSIAIVDLNKDNHMDIAVANRYSHDITILLGTGNGTILKKLVYPTSSVSLLISIIVADMNGDFIPDVIFVDANKSRGNIGILFGFGDGIFAIPKIYYTDNGAEPSSIAVGDLNGDGSMDIVESNPTSRTMSILLNHKNEPFASRSDFSTGTRSRPISVGVGDFNSDSNLDIVVANFGHNSISVFLGFGNGLLSQPLVYSTGDASRPSAVAVNDLNKDENIDIAVTNSASDNVYIFAGHGNGSFTIFAIISTGLESNPTSIVIEDLNRDDYVDLVIANYGINNILIYLGSENGNFLRSQSYSVGYNALPLSIAIGDINNDSMLDIIVANYGSNYVEILLQTC